MVTPDGRELMLAVDEAYERLARRVLDAAATRRTNLTNLRHRLALASPRRRLQDQREALTDRSRRLGFALSAVLRVRQSELATSSGRLEALSPLATLERGYSHVSRRADGRTVKSVREARPGTGLIVRLVDGTFPAVVEGQPHLLPPEDVSE